MIKSTLSVVAAASLALGFAATAALSQTPAPVAPAATKAPAAVAKPAVKKAAPKTASACQGLPEAGCKGKTGCAWIVPKKANASTGKVGTAYCRVVAGVAKKAAEKKAAAPVAAPQTVAAAPAKKVVKKTPAVKPPAAAAGGAPKTQ